MARIGLTLSGIERSLLNRLADANAAVTLSSLRMATGHKINYPRDDPSAFVALSSLQAQMSGVTAALSNVTAAGSMVTQTRSTLTQIRTQLNTARTELVKDESHSLSSAQRAECQAKIDAAIDQINTLSGATINGRRVLDGSADYTFLGRDYNQVTDLAVYATNAVNQAISGRVNTTATHAELAYTGDADNKVTANATFTLTGNRGSLVVTVTSGQLLSDVAATINNNSHKTGVTAAVDGDLHKLTFTTVDYGSSATIAVAVSSGTFSVTGGNGNGTANGANASAVINGQTIGSTSNNIDGNRFTVDQNGLRFSIEFKASFTGDFDTITIGGSALSFALSTDVGRRSTLAIPGMQASLLGGQSGNLQQLYSGGSLAGLSNNTAQAICVVDEALGHLTRVDGVVGGFYNAAISSTSALLGDLQTNLQTSIDDIDEVDDEEEIEVQSHYATLAANAIAGLTILNQQRAAIAALIQHIAGLD
jgi:flagellin-like hook-associated protein FlgL